MGPPAAWIAVISLAKVASAPTTASLVGPLLSWISSTATRSGARRLSTIRSASSANFCGGSAGSRFSTLKVATASWLAPAVAVVSLASPPETAVGVEVTSSLKLPNE